MIPRRIIPHILPQQLLHALPLVLLIPKPKPLHKPLSITPDVVVLAVLREHVVQELRFTLGRVERVDDGLAVVPDLVVFEVAQGDGVEPGDFVLEGSTGCEDCFGAVEPVITSHQ